MWCNIRRAKDLKHLPPSLKLHSFYRLCTTQFLWFWWNACKRIDNAHDIKLIRHRNHGGYKSVMTSYARAVQPSRMSNNLYLYGPFTQYIKYIVNFVDAILTNTGGSYFSPIKEQVFLLEPFRFIAIQFVSLVTFIDSSCSSIKRSSQVTNEVDVTIHRIRNIFTSYSLRCNAI